MLIFFPKWVFCPHCFKDLLNISFNCETTFDFVMKSSWQWHVQVLYASYITLDFLFVNCSWKLTSHFLPKPQLSGHPVQTERGKHERSAATGALSRKLPPSASHCPHFVSRHLNERIIQLAGSTAKNITEDHILAPRGWWPGSLRSFGHLAWLVIQPWKMIYE